MLIQEGKLVLVLQFSLLTLRGRASSKLGKIKSFPKMTAKHFCLGFATGEEEHALGVCQDPTKVEERQCPEDSPEWPCVLCLQEWRAHEPQTQRPKSLGGVMCSVWSHSTLALRGSMLPGNPHQGTTKTQLSPFPFLL